MKTENIEILGSPEKDYTKKTKNFTGVVRGTRSRYGFLNVSNHEDIFIKPQEMDKVFSGDTVEVVVKNYGEKNQFVIIEKVIKTEKKVFMGLFSEDDTGAYVLPDDYGFNRKIRIPKAFKMKARNNQYVKIEIIEHPFKSKKPKAKVVDVVGDKNSWHIQADYNLSKYGIDSYVSDSMNCLCSDMVNDIDIQSKNFSKKRKDLTKIDFFTIDGENTVDIDDAIYVQKLEDKWKMLVAISDVSEFVKENCDIDKDAYNRMSTVYLVGKTIPMLSSELTDLLSLKPLNKRLVVVADITINLDGTIDKYNFYEAVIESKAKLSYNEVDDFVNSGELDICYSKVKEPLKNLKELHFLLRESRAKNNVLPPNRVDFRNFLDFNRKIENVERLDTKKSHRMVEEAMLCANRCAADFVSNEYGDAIYKTQDGLVENKITPVFYFLQDYIELEKEMLTNFEGFKKVMSLIEAHEESYFLKSVVNLYLKESDFSKTPREHTSMGFDNYTYFTSPIRRYTDIIIHRIIKSKIRKKKYKIQKENYLEHFRNKAQRIQKCVRDTEKWMQADYLRSLDKNEVFEAKIVGVSSSSLMIQLVDFGIEGVLLLNKLQKNGEKAYVSKLNVKIGDDNFKILDKINVSIDRIIDEDHSVMFKLHR